MLSGTRFFTIALTTCLLWSGAAVAKKAAVPPLVARSTSAETVLSMTTLISSEMEFMGEFDEVVQLEKRPSQLGSNCLGSSACLAGIARSNGSQSLVAGSVSKVGTEYKVRIVYVDGGRIVRTVNGTMPTDPVEVADQLADLVREAVTGISPSAKAEENKVTGFEGGAMVFLDDDDEEEEDAFLVGAPAVSRRIQTPARGGEDDYEEMDEFDEEEAGYGRAAAYGAAAGGAAAASAAAAAAQRRAAQEAQQRAAEAARAQAAEQARRRAAEAASQRAAMAAQRRAAEQAAQRAAEEARRRAAEAARYQEMDEDDFDPNAITFGGSAEDIEYEDIEFGRSSARVEREEAPRYREPVYRDPMEDRGYYDDLDEPVRQAKEKKRRPPPANRSSGRSSSRSPAYSSNAGSIGLAGRVGYSRFQALSFLTYGIEVAFQAQDNLALVAGLEAYSTRRILPPDLVPEGQPAVQWNTVLPLNLGMLYKPSSRDIQPYVGGEAQIIPAYVQTETGAATAFGFRGRAGVDFKIADNFGLNLNAATGIWSGSEFNRVQAGLANTGLVPQISAGTVFVF